MRRLKRFAAVIGIVALGAVPVAANAAPLDPDKFEINEVITQVAAPSDTDAHEAEAETEDVVAAGEERESDAPVEGDTGSSSDNGEDVSIQSDSEVEDEGGVAESAESAESAELAEEDSPNLLELSLLNINDFHGRIAGTLVDGKLTASPTVQFAGTIEQLRAVHGADNTLFMSAGDNLGASLFPSAILQDVPTIDLLNTLDMRATAVGNHEFDGGMTDIARIQSLLNAPILGANVYYKDSGELAFPAYTIEEAAGLRVGITGVAPQDTPFLVGADLSMLEFGDPVEGVNNAIATMAALPESERPDVYIALYHEGAESGQASSTLEEQMRRDPQFAAIVKETSPLVDVIFTAHTHQEYDWTASIPGTDRERPIMQTGQYGANVGNVVLSVDPESKEVVDFETAIVPVTKTPMQELVDTYPESLNEVVRIVTEAVVAAEVEGGVVVGSITAPLTRAYTHGAYVDGLFELTDESVENRQQESPIGIAVSNALRDATADYGRPADFGVGNAGGLRADLYPGEDGQVTMAEVRSVLPFSGEVSNVTMTGAQIKRLLEQQWEGTFQQLALSDNFSYTYTEVADPAGGEDPVGYIWQMMLDGEPVEMDQEYVVATYKFLAAGGDGFTEFLEGAALHTGIPDWQAWVEYLEAASPLQPDFARRAVKVDGPLGDVWKAGETVELRYSNLNMPAVGVPENTEANVSLGAVSVSAAVVEGATTIKVDIPEAAAGSQVLTLTLDPTGTEATNFVEVEKAEKPDGGGENGSENGGTKPGESKPGTGKPGENAPSGSLPVTGASVLGLLIAAGALGLGGVAAVRLSRSRS